ncbi:MAG: hypothetical protein KJO99_05610 [Nitrosopumilus sp.]|nr:hypothetical protein [Nitrosopumilus sp.]NNL53470.1 hypothetical protein [Nitrosopumilus sp.]
MISKPFLGILGILMVSVYPVYAHTLDSVGNYRLEIGWMNEPVVSGETNGIELYVSPLKEDIPVEDQSFHDGIAGLEKTLKMELVFQSEKITLPLSKDHDIPGKYYAFVDPTASGFYQANILGKIGDTIVSLSMHPPKVDERSYIEFPKPSDITIQQIITGHTAVIEDINEIKLDIKKMKETDQSSNIGVVGMGLGIAGIVIAIVALTKNKKN